jgi:hypothetical protein
MMQIDNLSICRELINEGQENYRLRKEVNICPKFDNPLHIAAWKFGYYSAMHKIPLNAAVEKFKERYNHEGNYDI